MSKPDPPYDVPPYDVVVLGGGPAGLTAGLLAARAGRRVALLERAAQVGGMARSVEVSGIRVDHGSHRLHPSASTQVRALVDELLGSDLQVRPRHGRLLLGASWVGFPLQAAELAQALPPSAVAAIGAAAMVRPPGRAGRRAARATTYAEAVTAKLGTYLYRTFYGPFAVKLWGLDGEQIDAEQARVRVSADSPWSILGRVLRSGRTARDTAQGQDFLYPRRGFGEIVDRLAVAAVEAGVDIHTDAAVEQVFTDDDGVLVEIAGAAPVRASHVVSSIALPTLARMTLGAPVPPRPLRMRGMALVYLTHHGGRWTPYDAHYLPTLTTPVTRISEPANYRDSADDPADRSVVCFELPCDPGGPLWELADEQLGQVAEETIRLTGLPRVDRRDSKVVVRRLPQVYPIFTIGYRDLLQPLEAWVDAQPRITAIGRLGLFAHDNTHHAMDSAFTAVAAIRPDGTRDEALWAEARAQFARIVVED